MSKGARFEFGLELQEGVEPLGAHFALESAALHPHATRSQCSEHDRDDRRQRAVGRPFDARDAATGDRALAGASCLEVSPCRR